MFSGLSCWPASLAAFWVSLVGPSGTRFATDKGLVAALPASSLLLIRSPALRAGPLGRASAWVVNPAAVAAMLPASPTPGIRVIGEGGGSGVLSTALAVPPSSVDCVSAAWFHIRT